MIAPRRLWLADAAGHSVDLLPVDLNAAPYRGSDGDAPVFSAGVVGGEPVP
jgi:hypothetical protein